MDPVRGADAAAVAVAGVHEDVQVRPLHLDALGDRKRPAVKAVEAVGLHVVGEPAGAADARDEDGLLGRQLLVAAQPLHGRQDAVVATPRAPARNVALVILQSVVLVVGHELIRVFETQHLLTF